MTRNSKHPPYFSLYLIIWSILAVFLAGCVSSTVPVVSEVFLVETAVPLETAVPPESPSPSKTVSLTSTSPTAVDSQTPPATETAVPPQPSVSPTETSTKRPLATATFENTAVPEPTPPAELNAIWLETLNAIRWQAGLPPVTIDEQITLGAQAHSEYMGRSDNPFARSERTNNPFYTDEGRIAAYRSNIFTLSSPGGTDLWALNFWLSAPFHALGLLDPQLQEVGYGRFRDDLGIVKVASVLDVQSGLVESPPAVTFPIFYPPDGGETYILRQTLLEYPEPLASCPGFTKPAGPPLIVQLGDGRLTPTINDFGVWVDGVEVPACAFSETTYSNPTDHAQIRGRELLNWRDAVVIIPQRPFGTGQTITAELTSNGQTHRWSFTTVNPPYIDIEPIPLSDPIPWYGINIAGFNFGGQTHELNNPQLMKQTGMTWVKFQLKWRADSRPEEIVEKLTLAKAHGFKVLVSVTGDPYPSSIDYEAFTEFMRGLAALKPAPDGIEVWNEMNIDFEWPAGNIDPAEYVEKMLQPAYFAIKAENPDIIVISGAPAPTGFDNGTNAWADSRYMVGMAQAGAGNYVDCIGIHYNEGATSPYDTQGHPGGGYYGWYFLPSLESAFFAFGSTRPLCITELGILSGEGYGGVPGRFWWADGTTDEEQAQWLAEALTLANQSGYVRMAIVFNVDIFHWEDDPQAGFAIIRPGGDCKFCELVLGR